MATKKKFQKLRKNIMLNKEIYHDGFEERFSQKEKIEILGGALEVADLKPENPKTEVPVLFAPGWSGTPETYKDAIKTLYEKNRRVLSFAHARKGGDEKLAPDELQKIYPADELRKALALLKILDEKNIDKVDVVAHSEGGINAAIAASLAPEKFRNIVFVNPAGLIGKDKFPKLAGRFMLEAIRMAGDLFKMIMKKEKKEVWRFFTAEQESLKYIGKNPIRALNEAVAISQIQTHKMLKDLRDQGIGIAVISGVEDLVFPINMMQTTMKGAEIDAFLSVKGGHNEIVFRPEKYTAAADELLDKLEKKNL